MKCFLHFVNSFHILALKHRKITFLILVSLWASISLSFFRLELNNSSELLLPDTSMELRRIVQSVDIIPTSRLLYVDIFHERGDTARLQEVARLLEDTLPQKSVTSLTLGEAVTPKDITPLIPNFFDEKAETSFFQYLQSSQLEEDIQKSISMLSGFTPKSFVDWIRYDPLNRKYIVLENLPLQTQEEQKKLGNYTLSNDEKHLLLVFRPQFSIHDTEKVTELVNHIFSLQKEVPDVRIMLNGGIAHTAVNTFTIERDIKNIAIFSFIGIALIYLYFIRSLSGIWLLLTPVVAVGMSLGLMSLGNARLSGLALGFGVAVLTIAEDYAVHIYFAMRREKDIKNVFKALLTPLFQGFLLNSTGFFVLLFSSIPAVRQLATFSLLSLFCGFVIAVFILPLCPIPQMKRLKTKPREEQSPHELSLRPLRWRCVLTTLILLFACVVLFQNSTINVSPVSMGAPLNVSWADSQAFAKTWGGNNSDIILLEGQSLDTVLSGAKKIADTLKDYPLSTIANLTINVEKQKQNIERWQRFVRNHGEETERRMAFVCQENNVPLQVFAPFLSLLYAEANIVTLEDLQNTPASTFLDLFITQNHTNNTFQTILISPDRISDTAIKQVRSIAQECAVSVSVLSENTITQAISEAFYGDVVYLPMTLLLCVLILYICLRNMDKVFLALIPALCALCAVFMVLYVLDAPITFAGLAALLLVLGLALDHGILVTHSLEHATHVGTHKALFVSSLTTMMGMGLLMFSSHPVLYNMGLVIFTGLFVEIPASLYVIRLMCKEEKTYA